MRARPARFVAVAVAAATATCGLLTGCGEEPRSAPASGVSATPTPVGGQDPRTQLAARVAAAKDRRYVAGYSLAKAGTRTRAVMVTVAADGTWRVDIQGGALGGTVDVAIAGRPEGQYQCGLSAGASCVRVATTRGKLPPAVDPRVQYPFTTWLDILIDRQAALSIALATALPGATGTCFSVEPTAAAMQPVIDSAVLCFADDGALTAAKSTFGTLTLTGQSSSPPPTVTLPGPVAAGAPLQTAAPPPPSATASKPAGSAPATRKP